MMKSEDTDKLIRSKLENYSVTPPAHVWSQVQHQLENNKRKTRLLWYKTAAAAAVLALVFSTGWFFSENNKRNIVSESGVAVQQPVEKLSAAAIDEPAKKNDTKIEVIAENVTRESKIFVENKAENVLFQTAGNDSKNNGVNRTTIAFAKINSRNSRFETDPFPQQELKRKPGENTDLALLDFEKEIVKRNLQELEDKSREDGNWKMGMFLTPGYSSYAANHSSEYEQNMTYSGSGGNANVGGGLSLVYKTSRRLMVESGVYYAQNGQKTSNSMNLFAKNLEADYAFAPGELTYSSNDVQLNNGSMAMNSTAGVIAFSSTPKGAEFSGGFETESGKTNLLVPEGEFSQVFEFIEVPLLVRYRVVDARLGVELMTGITTGFLVGNNAYIDNQYGLQNIGKTEDISNVNLSGTLGVGTSYSLTKNLSFALEPRFSYYFNSINKNPEVSFKPYRIGIFTGLTYDF